MQNRQDYWTEMKTRDGSLTGQVNSFYAKIINWEVVQPWYSTRLRNKHFFLKKRKWYKKLQIFFTDDLYKKYNGWSVTDIKEINESVCKTDNCKRYYRLENSDWTRFVIIAESCSCTW